MKRRKTFKKKKDVGLTIEFFLCLFDLLYFVYYTMKMVSMEMQFEGENVCITAGR